MSQILADVQTDMRHRRVESRTLRHPKWVTEIVAPLVPWHAVPLISGQCRIRRDRLDMVVRPDQENGYRLGTEDRETCLLKMQEGIAERWMGSAVAICNNCL